MKILMMVTAIIETVVGVGFFLMPAVLVPALFGSPVDSATGIVAGRLAGAGMISLAMCCWQARNSEVAGAALGVVMGMLFYNIAAAAIAAYAGVRLGLVSPYIWPMIVLHAVLAFWCGLVIRSATRRHESTVVAGAS